MGAPVRVELAGEAARAVARLDGADPRFTKGTIKAAVRWALRAVAKSANGDDEALAEVARAGDVPGLHEVLGPPSGARVVDARLHADPPHVVVEVLPSGSRAVLKAVEFPTPGWRLASLVPPGVESPAPVPERVVKFDLPAEARGGGQLDWILGVLVDAAAVLGVDIRPAVVPGSVWSTEDLGQGERRSTESKAWTGGGGSVHVSAEVDEHEIFDGATPRWTYLRGTATGLPGGAAVSVVASDRRGTLFLVGPRHRIDRVPVPGER